MITEGKSLERRKILGTCLVIWSRNQTIFFLAYIISILILHFIQVDKDLPNVHYNENELTSEFYLQIRFSG